LRRPSALLRKVQKACGQVKKGSERFRKVQKACGLVEKGYHYN
jgi:hypothetical protein